MGSHNRGATFVAFFFPKPETSLMSKEKINAKTKGKFGGFSAPLVSTRSPITLK